MNRSFQALVLVTAFGLVAAPAVAQTLTERIAAVRKKREQDKAASVLALKTRLLQALLYTPLSVDFAELGEQIVVGPFSQTAVDRRQRRAIAQPKLQVKKKPIGHQSGHAD